jgi:glycosyltransferase involved in cell wall biosynthesis
MNAIDLGRFEPGGLCADLDRLAGMPPAAPGTIRVGLMATMARWKGHGVFLDAISKIPAEVPFRAYVIGGSLYQTDGSQCSVEELRTAAAQMGISHLTGFTGFIDRPAEILRALDIVVHASTEPEPFGLVIVEAMACGRAVIVSQAGGAAEIIDEGVDALAHTPGDAAQLAQRIQQLALDGELRRRLGENGRAKALRCFDRARLTRDWVAIYQEVAGIPRNPSFSSHGIAGTAKREAGSNL